MVVFVSCVALQCGGVRKSSLDRSRNGSTLAGFFNFRLCVEKVLTNTVQAENRLSNRGYLFDHRGELIQFMPYT